MAVVVDYLGKVVCTDVNSYRWLEADLVCKDCPISKLLNTYESYKELLNEHGNERYSDEQRE